MRKNIAAALRISQDQVGIKATTEEGLGFTGAGEGISSTAITLLTTVADNCYYDRMAAPSGCGGCGGCPVRD